ncbi:MAG: TIGR02266 family protein [Deltaproteobacteria bacterium]|nr:TIGR02266 family protein [Deltaproteobacteria bacterium]
MAIGTPSRRTAPSSTAITKIEILFRDVPAFLKSYIAKITNGGLFIKTDSPLPLETTVKLAMTLPGNTEPIEANGEVVFTTPKAKKGFFPLGMGIKLSNISPENLEKINKLVKENEEKLEDLSAF